MYNYTCKEVVIWFSKNLNLLAGGFLIILLNMTPELHANYLSIIFDLKPTSDKTLNFFLVKSRKLWSVTIDFIRARFFIFCPCLLSRKRHIVPVHTSREKIKKESSWDKKADNSMWDKNSGDGYNRDSYKRPYWDYIRNLQGYSADTYREILWFYMQCHENFKNKWFRYWIAWLSLSFYCLFLPPWI